MVEQMHTMTQPSHPHPNLSDIPSSAEFYPAPSRASLPPLYFSKAKIVFQSDFMLTTVQLFSLASSQALSSRPTCD